MVYHIWFGGLLHMVSYLVDRSYSGGLLNKPYLPILIDVNSRYGDAITRFSGIVLCCIMTGVIWIGDPESFVDVLLYDNLHVLLWVGALFFALRGNNAK